MKTVGNILWFVLGGFLIVLEYFISSILMLITIIGIPFAIQTFKIAVFAVAPFGKKTVTNPSESGCLNTFMNILWILIGGIWICITHLVLGVCFYITIIGIPFGNQHFKLAKLALAPFGTKIEG